MQQVFHVLGFSFAGMTLLQNSHFMKATCRRCDLEICARYNIRHGLCRSCAESLGRLRVI